MPAGGDLGRGNEPAPAIPDQNEEVVEARRIQSLHQPVPALIASAGAEGHIPSILDGAGRSLHLHPDYAAIELSEKIPIATAADRNRNRGPS